MKPTGPDQLFWLVVVYGVNLAIIVLFQTFG